MSCDWELEGILPMMSPPPSPKKAVSSAKTTAAPSPETTSPTTTPFHPNHCVLSWMPPAADAGASTDTPTKDHDATGTTSAPSPVLVGKKGVGKKGPSASGKKEEPSRAREAAARQAQAIERMRQRQGAQREEQRSVVKGSDTPSADVHEKRQAYAAQGVPQSVLVESFLASDVAGPPDQEFGGKKGDSAEFGGKKGDPAEFGGKKGGAEWSGGFIPGGKKGLFEKGDDHFGSGKKGYFERGEKGQFEGKFGGDKGWKGKFDGEKGKFGKVDSEGKIGGTSANSIPLGGGRGDDGFKGGNFHFKGAYGGGQGKGDFSDHAPMDSHGARGFNNCNFGNEYSENGDNASSTAAAPADDRMLRDGERFVGTVEIRKKKPFIKNIEDSNYFGKNGSTMFKRDPWVVTAEQETVATEMDGKRVEFTLKVHTKPNGEVRPQAKNVRVLHGDGKVRQNRFLTLGDKITADGGYLELKPAEWRKICEFLCRVDEDTQSECQKINLGCVHEVLADAEYRPKRGGAAGWQ